MPELIAVPTKNTSNSVFQPPKSLRKVSHFLQVITFSSFFSYVEVSVRNFSNKFGLFFEPNSDLKWVKCSFLTMQLWEEEVTRHVTTSGLGTTVYPTCMAPPAGGPRIPPGCLRREVSWACPCGRRSQDRLRTESELLERSYCVSWPENTLVSSQRRSWRRRLGRQRSGPLCFGCYPQDPNPDKQKSMDQLWGVFVQLFHSFDLISFHQFCYGPWPASPCVIVDFYELQTCFFMSPVI